jgi:uncharacterized protein (TIGR03118 family)
VYLQTNLVSDGSVPAFVVDPDLINPWGIAHGPKGPFWVSDNGRGLATIYGDPGGKNKLVVTIPAASGLSGDTSAPTGVVFNGSSADFKLSNGSRSLFLFASEDGAISGWGGGTSAEIVGPHSSDAVYKGLAIDDKDGILFAANFHSGMIEAYDSNFNAPTSLLPDAFTDPDLPKGFGPFNLSVLNGKLYVTYAKQDDAKHDDDAGAHRGFVDVFNLDGSLDTRLISRGALNSPWGLAIAPSTPSFGPFAGALLVGNFGDGKINAYDPTTGAPIGVLDGKNGDPLSIPELWGLTIGDGGLGGGSPNFLYFTAGLKDESHGLFGSLSPAEFTAVPEPSTWAMMLLGFAGLGFAGFRHARKAGSATA